MMKFTDVCKAYIRYFYVIIVCMVLVLGLVLLVVPHKTTYKAESTIVIRGTEEVANKNEFISDGYAASVIKEMDVRIAHKHFSVILNSSLDEKLAKKYSVETLQNGLNVTAKKDDRFFLLSFTCSSKDDAIAIVNNATKLAVSEYATVEGSKARLEPLYDIEITKNSPKIAVYAVIGLLAGLVLGVVIVTLFVVFNPYVENKDLLEKGTGLTVLASLDKE